MKPRFFKIDLGTVMVLLFIGLFAVLYVYMNNPSYAITILTVGSMMTLPIGMFLGIVFSSGLRLKFLRGITKKNYGYIKFVYGASIKSVIVNLDQDIVQFRDGTIFLIDKMRIKRQLKDGTAEDLQKEVKEQVKFEEGIPVIYYDIEDIVPTDFNTTSKDDKDSYRIPSHAGATLHKEIAVEKAKALQQQSKKVSMIAIFVIINLLITVAMGYLVFKLSDKVDKISSLGLSVDMSVVTDKLDVINGLMNRLIVKTGA